MTAESKVRTPSPEYMEPWPPDDTEESISGTNLHQTTIINLTTGINAAADLQRQTDEPLPWEASDQILILGWRRPDGSAYRAYPDVFVYPRPIDPNRPSMAITLDGPPVLIIEVLSESSYDVDIDINAGKGYSYCQAGVREYLALDPTGMFIPDGVRGWRLVDDRYEPWERDARGRWSSQGILRGSRVRGGHGDCLHSGRTTAASRSRGGPPTGRAGGADGPPGSRDRAVAAAAPAGGVGRSVGSVQLRLVDVHLPHGHLAFGVSLV